MKPNKGRINQVLWQILVITFKQSPYIFYPNSKIAQIHCQNYSENTVRCIRNPTDLYHQPLLPRRALRSPTPTATWSSADAGPWPCASRCSSSLRPSSGTGTCSSTTRCLKFLIQLTIRYNWTNTSHFGFWLNFVGRGLKHPCGPIVGFYFASLNVLLFLIVMAVTC